MKKPLSRHVAFLRGINVGGNKKVPMADLKRMLEALGYQSVKTLLASGNVLFETSDAPAGIKQACEKKFEQTFGFSSSVIIRPFSAIQALVAAEPFRNVKVTPQTRLYVTFLPEKMKCALRIPYTSPEKDFQILRVTDGEVFSVLTLGDRTRTVDSMEILEREFGKNITTRNWNTVVKLAG